jgi:hypothetical protein
MSVTVLIILVAACLVFFVIERLGVPTTLELISAVHLADATGPKPSR